MGIHSWLLTGRCNTNIPRLRRGGQNLILLHRPQPGASPNILLDSYPRDVALSFSKLVRRKLSNTAQSTQVPMTRVIIDGGDPQRLRKVFSGAVASCNGSGVQPYNETATSTPFVEAVLDRQAAQFLEVELFVREVTIYINMRLSACLSGAEIVRLREMGIYSQFRPTYAATPAAEMCTMISILGPENRSALAPLARFVASMIWSEMRANPSRLRGPATNTTKYRAIRQRFPIFNEGVNHFVERLRNGN